ncbi:hypothetical protein LMH87_004654 [Akanthomyces muscarius]|uniref:Uncharacterized protein n=1 Tax=Akanthomyces muscarius TaxID=2231603 RepID=A0A9W8Q6X0_AKAMU|nr:hypothetical protein LMH87_004654 [Akanthomyces muscarius]KAJ4145822.1 hypothetical protein LMH87_004654 [Akanthomyces muscarius]
MAALGPNFVKPLENLQVTGCKLFKSYTSLSVPVSIFFSPGNCQPLARPRIRTVSARYEAYFRSPSAGHSGAATPTSTGAVSLTSALDLLEGARQRWPGQYGNATDEQIAQKEKEFGGELHLDKEGNRVPISFGMEALLTLFDGAPDGMFIWPHLPDKGNPITDSPHDFKDTECTGLAVDPFEERRASRHLEYMCNRFQLPNNSLYASTSGKTTIYMCPYKDLRNCSLPLWRAASEHLDRQCGRGRSGYVHLRKLRIGRAPVDGDRVIICEGLHYAPLDEYRISQRPALADGMPYEEWRILNRRKQMREELVPKDINEGNDGNP